MDKYDLPDSILEEALNAALVIVQDHIGQTDGGLASIIFSGNGRDGFDAVMQSYATAERNHAKAWEEAPAAPPAIALFKIGETYSTRSACDHDCIYSFKIVRRTAKQITFLYHGKEETRGVREYGGEEVCSPFGRYSMSPTIHAGKAGEIY